MPKSIYFTDEAYEQITEAARQCGFRVSRGRGSQIALFVVTAANNACSGLAFLLADQECPHCHGIGWHLSPCPPRQATNASR